MLTKNKQYNQKSYTSNKIHPLNDEASEQQKHCPYLIESEFFTKKKHYKELWYNKPPNIYNYHLQADVLQNYTFPSYLNNNNIESPHRIKELTTLHL